MSLLRQKLAWLPNSVSCLHQFCSQARCGAGIRGVSICANLLCIGFRHRRTANDHLHLIAQASGIKCLDRRLHIWHRCC